MSGDSRISDSNSMQVRYSERSGNTVVSTASGLITEFSKDMFVQAHEGTGEKPNVEEEVKVPKLEAFNTEYIIPESDNFSQPQSTSKGTILLLSIIQFYY